MSATTFDTHAAVKRLQAAGATVELAEAVVDTMLSCQGNDIATYSDLAELRLDMNRLERRVTNLTGWLMFLSILICINKLLGS